MIGRSRIRSNPLGHSRAGGRGRIQSWQLSEAGAGRRKNGGSRFPYHLTELPENLSGFNILHTMGPKSTTKVRAGADACPIQLCRFTSARFRTMRFLLRNSPILTLASPGPTWSISRSQPTRRNPNGGCSLECQQQICWICVGGNAARSCVLMVGAML